VAIHRAPDIDVPQSYSVPKLARFLAATPFGAKFLIIPRPRYGTARWRYNEGVERLSTGRPQALCTPVYLVVTSERCRPPFFGRAKEKRRTARRPGSARGILTYARGAASIACVVCDFSSMGARVQAQGKVAIPDEVYLVFPESKRAYSALVAWRSERSVGLKFTGVIDVTDDLSLDLQFLKWMIADHKSS